MSRNMGGSPRSRSWTTTTWLGPRGSRSPGLPADIVQTMNQETIKALASPAVKKRLDQESIDTGPMSPVEFASFVESEIEKWGPIAKAAISTSSGAAAR